MAFCFSCLVGYFFFFFCFVLFSETEFYCVPQDGLTQEILLPLLPNAGIKGIKLHIQLIVKGFSDLGT